MSNRRTQKLVLTPRGERAASIVAGTFILTMIALVGSIEGGAF